MSRLQICFSSFLILAFFVLNNIYRFLFMTTCLSPSQCWAFDFEGQQMGGVYLYTCVLLVLQVLVLAYNPLSRPVSTWLRLPVTQHSVTVRDAEGQQLPSQVGHALPSHLTPRASSVHPGRSRFTFPSNAQGQQCLAR